MTLNQKIFSASGNFTARYILQGDKKAKCLFILLHGYSQTGEVIYNKIFNSLPAGCAILAPNGPFPVPEAVTDGFRVGFSWYFHDNKTDEYYVDMELGRNYLKILVEKLDLENIPKIIIGYSQGGYLAPFAAQELKRVKQVLGINCQFLDEELTGALPPRMDLIHGEKDEVVEPQNSKTSFEKLIAKGMKGKYVAVAGAGHGISPPVLAELEKLIALK